jgi:cobalt-zinc-cadmium efflux system protein
MSKAGSHHHSHAHHHHGHHHHHGGAEGRLGLAFFLNLIFAIIELIGGLLTNSLAIISDAFHDLGDCFAIGIAWYLEKKSKTKSSTDFSYGYRRLSVMAALITGLILCLGSCLIIAKAIPRLLQPELPQVPGMIGLAVLGLLVNGMAALKVAKGESLNERMILVHLMEDVLGWFVILIGALVMLWKPLPILDPLMAIGVAIWVLWNAFHNLKETMRVFLQAKPDQFEIAEVEAVVRRLPLVQDLHHTHIWTMDGQHHILTTHLIVQPSAGLEQVHELKSQIKKELFAKFHIQEATIEVEWPNQKCADPNH